MNAVCMTPAPIGLALQPAAHELWDSLFRLKDPSGRAIDISLQATYERIASALAAQERPDVRKHYERLFLWAFENGAIPGERIMRHTAEALPSAEERPVAVAAGLEELLAPPAEGTGTHLSYPVQGAINLVHFVLAPFTSRATFDWDAFERVIRLFTRMLDNAVDLPGVVPRAQKELFARHRGHAMGFLGLGSVMAMLGITYGSADSLELTTRVSSAIALEGWRAGLDLAREKGPALVLLEDFTLGERDLLRWPDLAAEGWSAGMVIPSRLAHARFRRFMERIALRDPELVDDLASHGSRFTQHACIGATEVMALSLGNNASRGFYPSFAHHQVERETSHQLFSYEYLAFSEVYGAGQAQSHDSRRGKLPAYFVTAEDVTADQFEAVATRADFWFDVPRSPGSPIRSMRSDSHGHAAGCRTS